MSIKMNLRSIQSNLIQQSSIHENGLRILKETVVGLILWLALFHMSCAHAPTTGHLKKNYPNGDRYTGTFENGKKHGQGTYTWSNGNQYQGEYRNDMRHGEGSFTWANGSHYTGQWRENKENGFGRYRSSSGDTYEGNFKNGRFDGAGKLTKSNGDQYSGEFHNGIRNGKGTYTWQDTTKYSGYWKHDKMHGSGILLWPNGDTYEGHFENNRIAGSGSINWKDGTRYEGIFKSDQSAITGMVLKKNGIQDYARIKLGPLETPWQTAPIYKAASPVQSQMPPHGQTPRLNAPIAGKANFGNYHALIIGINKYIHLPRLQTAESDALAIARLLEAKYGFTTKLLLNPKRTDIIKALTHYRHILNASDNLMIYYAGHGWLDRDADEGYWLPVNATKEDESFWISNASITSALRAIKAKHIFIVSDSCYSGKLVRGLQMQRKSDNYVSRIMNKKARVVLTSGGLEPVADAGGKGNHSVFASAFIDVLNENQGLLEGTQLFSHLRRRVIVNSDQTPEYSDIRKAGHDGGDFVFVPIK